jgi:hypothetical protein
MPVVTAEVYLTALDELVRLCLELGSHGPGRCQPCHQGNEHGSAHPGNEHGSASPTARGREALQKAIIGKAVDLLSGPGGLASFLRRGLLEAKLGGPSLPLDVGWSENIPAAIRNAVVLRDQHCRFPGGCFL